MLRRFHGSLLVLVLICSLTQAQIPRTLSYQGVLTDTSGTTPRPDGNYSFTFRLYDSTGVIWSETKTLLVKKGLFSTSLGDATPFSAAVKFDKPYRLGIQVGTEPELSPRIQLTSVGYSMNALRADTAKVALVSSGNGPWVGNDSIAYRLSGNVGIGTANPLGELDITTTGLNDPDINFNNDLGLPADISFNVNRGLTSLIRIGKDVDGATWDFQQRAPNEQSRLFIAGNGSVGIGTSSPQERLDVVGSIRTSGAGGGCRLVMASTAPGGQQYEWYNDGSVVGELELYNRTAQNVPIKFTSNGHTKVPVLEITGGSDLAEPFPITEPLPAGSVVVIDENNPGKLVQSIEPYDKRVAGIVSGAGGVQPGLTLKQEGLMEGNQNIALTGRVYVRATAVNGAIKPGDMLTTSTFPGHAMKATDERRTFGSVIGKAMGMLEQGEGLVLVLVNLH